MNHFYFAFDMWARCLRSSWVDFNWCTKTCGPSGFWIAFSLAIFDFREMDRIFGRLIARIIDQGTTGALIGSRRRPRIRAGITFILNRADIGAEYGIRGQGSDPNVDRVLNGGE